MKLAYVVTRFPKVSETFVTREALALQSLGADVEILSFVPGGGSQQEAAPLMPHARAAQQQPGEVIRANLRWLTRSPKAYLSAWRMAMVGNAPNRRFLIRAAFAVPIGAWIADRAAASGRQHLHAHFATHSTMAALVAHHLTGIPFSFTAHAHDIYVDRTMLKEKVGAAAVVVTISEHNRRLLIEHCGPETASKIEVIRCGADMAKFRPTQRSERGRELLCVAALEPKKGHTVLLKALAVLRDEGFEVRARLIGAGDLRSRLEAEIDQLVLTDLVTLEGSMDGHGVSEALARADVFVLPSVIDERGRTEGVPVALMEAMAAGVPVIASDVGGVSELVRDGDTGRLVTSGKAGELARAIESALIDRESSDQMAVQARQLVFDEYDLRANARTLLNVLTTTEPGERPG